MEWQEPIALTVVVATAAILCWHRFRPRQKFSKDKGCGCGSEAARGQQPTVIYRARKGQRTQVEYKMP